MTDEKEPGHTPPLRVVPGASPRPSTSSGRAELEPREGGPARIQSIDDALLSAFLVGDDDAFGELVRRHEPLVLSLVRRWARTPEDARDLAQRTFLRAFEATRRTFRRKGGDAVPFRRWLVRIAVNLAKNHLRDEARARRTPLESIGPADEPSTSPAADDESRLRAERAARVRAAVVRLPPRQREVFTLRIDAELPFAEIALALGTTENSAKVTFHHATKRLRALVADEESQP